MTYKKKSATKTEANSPMFHAYVVSGAKGDARGFWTKIGAVFAHEDGEGATLVLEALPLGGRVVLRTPKQDEATR